jgi:hypothetical protein
MASFDIAKYVPDIDLLCQDVFMKSVEDNEKLRAYWKLDVARQHFLKAGFNNELRDAILQYNVTFVNTYEGTLRLSPAKQKSLFWHPVEMLWTNPPFHKCLGIGVDDEHIPCAYTNGVDCTTALVEHTNSNNKWIIMMTARCVICESFDRHQKTMAQTERRQERLFVRAETGLCLYTLNCPQPVFAGSTIYCRDHQLKDRENRTKREHFKAQQRGATTGRVRRRFARQVWSQDELESEDGFSIGKIADNLVGVLRVLELPEMYRPLLNSTRDDEGPRTFSLDVESWWHHLLTVGLIDTVTNESLHCRIDYEEPIQATIDRICRGQDDKTTDKVGAYIRRWLVQATHLPALTAKELAAKLRSMKYADGMSLEWHTSTEYGDNGVISDFLASKNIPSDGVLPPVERRYSPLRLLK